MAGTSATLSWSSVLERNARQLGDKHAYIALLNGGTAQQALTFGELQQTVQQMGSFLAEALPRQACILILLPQDLSFIKAFLSCILAGMVAVPAYLPNNGKQVHRVQGIFTDARPRAVLWSKSSTPNLRRDLQEHNACANALWIDIDAVASERASHGFNVDPDDLAMLQYTSGSTDNPKGVMLTHRNLLANQEMIRDTFEHTDRSVILGCLPFYHDMGLIGNILQPLYVGATCIFLSALQVVRQPLSWLQSISRYRATTSGGPNFYYELCINRINEQASLGDLDLSCWQVAFNGSEPVRGSTIDEFARKFARHGFKGSAFLPVYGLAEASLLVTGRRKAGVPTVVEVDRDEYENHRILPRDSDTRRPSVRIVGCGLPPREVEVTVVDRSGIRLKECEIGEILVSSPSVARGYWSSRSDDTFATTVAGYPEGMRFLRTGDLGFVLNGELFVTGRAKESMIVGGRNYYPADIEQTLTRSCEALAGCRNAVFSLDTGTGEEIVAVQEVAARAADDYEAIRRTISRECWLAHEVQLFDIVLVRAGTIPRTTSGKTRRLLTKQLYTSGRLPAGGLVHGVPRGEQDTHGEGAIDSASHAVLQALITGVKGCFPQSGDRIHAGTLLGSLGMDSYTVVRLSGEVSELLGIDVPLMEFAKRRTINELARYIAANRHSFAQWRTPAVESERMPLMPRFRQSHGQIALWNREKLGGHGSALTVSRAVWVNKQLDPAAFEAAVASLMRRFDILRTELKEENSEPVQAIATDRKPSTTYVDAAHWDESRVERFLEEKANTRLDIANGETWHWFLLNRANGSVLLLTLHHIICDLETVNILIESLFRLCASLNPDLPDPDDRSYASYVESQHRFLDSEAGRASGLYWDRALKDVDLRLDIITKKEVGRATGTAAEFAELALDPSATAELIRKSRTVGAGLNVLSLAAFSVVLRRYTNQSRYAIGIPVSARTHTAFRGIPGYMVNVLPITVDFSVARNFGHIVRQTQERTLEALQYQLYPLPLIIQQYRRSRIELAQDVNPLNVIFTYQRSSLQDNQDTTAFAMNAANGRATQIGDLELRPVPVKIREIEFPLMMTAGVIEGSLVIQARWHSAVMYREVMRSMVEDYGGWLSHIAASRELEGLTL